MEPLLSIVTVSFNNRAGLEKTMHSVLSQVQKNFEWIVIDGGSTDGSRELLENNTGNIAYWVSEKDEGIYDAQNKGLRKALGKYLNFLNAGDTFFDGQVTGFFEAAQQKLGARFYYGNSNLVEISGQSRILNAPRPLDKYQLFKQTLNHQACFIARDLFKQYGEYNKQYKICADFDFLLNIFCQEPDSFCYLDLVVCNYDYSGFSSQAASYEQHLRERTAILRHRLGKKEYQEFIHREDLEWPIRRRILRKIYRIPLFGALIKRMFVLLFSRKAN